MLKKLTAKYLNKAAVQGQQLLPFILLKINPSEGIYSYNIKNPGGIIEATLHKSDGEFTKAMGGEVLLSEIVHQIL